MTEILEGPIAIARGVEQLAKGQLVAFPTETVYGLGADALDPAAVDRVFALKGRPSTNPLIVHVSGIEMAKTLVEDWTPAADTIAKAYWPGPMTIVLPKAACIPGNVSSDGPTVAIRCPAHPCALALIEAFGKPIVGPSANPSGRISPTTPEHVGDGFPNADLVVIDGGHCRAGIESTVLDLSTDPIRVLRPGIIGVHAIRETLAQPVECDTIADASEPARSPGTIGAHYQPRTPTSLVKSDQLSSAKPTTVLIAWSIDAHPSGGELIAMPSALSAYASAIYRSMHDADKAGANALWIEQPPQATTPEDIAIRGAIMERLRRAVQS